MRKFCGNAQFPHSFGRLALNYVETVSFRKISTSGEITGVFTVEVGKFWKNKKNKKILKNGRRQSMVLSLPSANYNFVLVDKII